MCVRSISSLVLCGEGRGLRSVIVDALLSSMTAAWWVLVRGTACSMNGVPCLARLSPSPTVLLTEAWLHLQYVLLRSLTPASTTVLFCRRQLGASSRFFHSRPLLGENKAIICSTSTPPPPVHHSSWSLYDNDVLLYTQQVNFAHKLTRFLFSRFFLLNFWSCVVVL